MTAPPNGATASSAVAENSVHGSSYHEPILSDIPVVSSGEAKSDKNPPTSSVDRTVSTCSSAPSTELDEIRQRRLQKFGPTTASLSDSGND